MVWILSHILVELLAVYHIAKNPTTHYHYHQPIANSNHHLPPSMKLQDEAMTGSPIPDDALRTKKDFKPGDPDSRGMNNEEKKADKARREGKEGVETNGMSLTLGLHARLCGFCSFLGGRRTMVL